MRKSRHYLILFEMGHIFLIVALMLISPIITLLWYPSEYKQMIYFIIPALFSAIIGYILIHLFKVKEEGILKKSDQVAILVSTWFISCIFLTFPFVLSGQLNFTQAFLETSSGLSTTGLSSFTGDMFNSLPKTFIIFRSLMQFYGGVGIVLFLVTVVVNTIGVEIYNTEGHTDRLTPHIKDSSRKILKIYIILIIIGFISLSIAGLFQAQGKTPLGDKIYPMDSFSAFNTAISAVATGGFAITPNSLWDYHSHLVNIIVMILMILGSISFYTHVHLFKFNFKKVIQIDEIKLFLKLILFFITISTIIAFFTIKSFDGNILKILEVSAFEIISAASGTGYSITFYSNLIQNHTNESLMFLVILSMLIGGAIGSTSGGIKVTRFNVMFKSLKWSIKKIYSSDNKLIQRSTITPTGKKMISDKEIISVFNYFLLYIIVLALGTLIFTASGYPLIQSLFEFASALGNVGLSTGITNAQLAPHLLWTLSIGMFIGRLEIFVVLGFAIRIVKRLINIKRS